MESESKSARTWYRLACPKRVDNIFGLKQFRQLVQATYDLEIKGALLVYMPGEIVKWKACLEGEYHYNPGDKFQPES